MTKQIQFFKTDTINLLEKHVNEFLKGLHWSSEVDVKYNHYFDKDLDDILYTAMVLYEPHDDSVPEGNPLNKYDTSGMVATG